MKTNIDQKRRSEGDMRAYRAAAIIERDHGLHLKDVPFQPGSPVEVIVLVEPTAQDSTKSPKRSEKTERILGLAGSWSDMPESEYADFLEELENRRRSLTSNSEIQEP